MGESRPLRVGFVTQQDLFFLNEFFAHLLEATPAHPEIDVGYALVLRPFDDAPLELARRLFRFYGLTGFVRLACWYACRLFLDATRLRRVSVTSLLREHGIAVTRPQDVNAPDVVGYVRERRTDVLVSVAAPQIFRRALIAAPRWGAINVHAAELPRYRGMMPNFWAMYHGESRAGITVHTIDESIDGGAAIGRSSVPIAPGDSLHDLIWRSKRQAADLLWEVLERIRSGEASATPYVGDSSYFSFPSRDDVLALRARGFSLF